MTDLYTPGVIKTFSGRLFNLLDPQPEQIVPSDIAIGLSRLCRFGGHTKKFYSVAEHSDWCRHQIALQYPDNIDLQLKALLHDAHEAYLGDVVTPLKKLLPNYEDIANKVQLAINKRFGITVTYADYEIIKRTDTEALEYEYEYKHQRFTGLELDEKSRVDLFIHHFIKLCKVPHVI